MPLGTLPFQLGANEEVEAGLGAVLLADLTEGIGTGIRDLVNVEAIAKVRYLDDNRLSIEALESSTVYSVLVWASDEALFLIDVVCEHGDLPRRRHGNHTPNTTRFWQLLDRKGTVEIVNQRPSPDVSEPANSGDVLGRHHCSGWGAA